MASAAKYYKHCLSEEGGGGRVGLWWFTPTWFVDDVTGNLVDDNVTSVFSLY